MSGLREMLRNRSSRETVYCTSNFWDEQAAAYDGDAVSMWPNEELNARYSKEHSSLINSWLPEVAGKRVLDVGCGTGRVSRLLARRGANVVGIDFSGESIKIARSHPRNTNVVFRVESVFELQEVEKYDVVVIIACLTVACRNRAYLVAALSRINNAMKDDARIVLFEPIHKGFLHRVLALSVGEFLQVLRESGFFVRRVRQLHFWPARLALAFLPMPRWITILLHAFGEGVMKAFGYRRFGDYTAVLAVKAPHRGEVESNSQIVAR